MALGAYRRLRRLLILLVGVSVILFGVVLIFTPGPAVVVIPVGLAILASEFYWAKRLLVRFRRKYRIAKKRFGRKAEEPPTL
ncbi:MAG: PGPGW domain-containing protein [Nitrospinae bacterium]|nr:PGPGW domain-containing protein [Nitrospinota bacterium]